jgi:hypothetical protein
MLETCNYLVFKLWALYLDPMLIDKPVSLINHIENKYSNTVKYK